jgi:hypothetical protein
MSQRAGKPSLRIEELIARAQERNIRVRKEKLRREAGYRARSGRCRLRGEELIILDRDAPLEEQLEVLRSELDLESRAGSGPPRPPTT